MLQFNLYYVYITFNNIAVFIFICLNICINIITCALINYIMPGADSTKENKAVKDRSGYVGLRTYVHVAATLLNRNLDKPLRGYT